MVFFVLFFLAGFPPFLPLNESICVVQPLFLCNLFSLLSFNLYILSLLCWIISPQRTGTTPLLSWTLVCHHGPLHSKRSGNVFAVKLSSTEVWVPLGRMNACALLLYVEMGRRIPQKSKSLIPNSEEMLRSPFFFEVTWGKKSICHFSMYTYHMEFMMIYLECPCICRVLWPTVCTVMTVLISAFHFVVFITLIQYRTEMSKAFSHTKEPLCFRSYNSSF